MAQTKNKRAKANIKRTKGQSATISRSISPFDLQYTLEPSGSAFVFQFNIPKFPRDFKSSSISERDLLSKDYLRKYSLTTARDTGDISRQLEVLDVKPGVPVVRARLPQVIDNVTVIMGDVFQNREAAINFLENEVSPTSGKNWIDAIAAGEIATFLVSLNEMKYGSRG
ncbi:MAG TPA: hypothetical protein VFU20_03370 [Sphingomicrobium sp.]|nr:hypothetical protein [Sphingomicrobium sp.]